MAIRNIFPDANTVTIENIGEPPELPPLSHVRPPPEYHALYNNNENIAFNPNASWTDTSLDSDFFDSIMKNYNTSDKMIINAIAAIGENNQLALNNNLPWHYPKDLELFENTVRNHTVIMGRLTFESIPKSFYEIPKNIIIISRTLDDLDQDNIYVADDIEEAIGIADDIESEQVWICGGVSVYKEALEKELIDELHISHIPYDKSADRFFPNFTKYIYGVKEGRTIECKNNKSFVYKVYIMKDSSIEEDNSLKLNDFIFDDLRDRLNSNSHMAPDIYSNNYLNVPEPRRAEELGFTIDNEVSPRAYLQRSESEINEDFDSFSNREQISNICVNACRQLVSQNPTFRPDTYEALFSHVRHAIIESFEEATVSCNISSEREPAYVHTIGRMQPVATDFGRVDTKLEITVNLPYNVYHIDISID